jgi:hypothetical protein
MTQLINTLEKPLSAFDPSGVQLAWDSTSLQALKKCPRYYYYSILEGWQPKGERVHLKFGTLFHRGMEILDHMRVGKEGLEEDDLITVLRTVMKEAGDVGEDGKWKPWELSNEKKNLESLVRALVWYFDHYRDDAFKVMKLANGKAAVELSFRMHLPVEFAGEALLYCGHLDSLGQYAESTYFLDRKTTGSGLNLTYFAQFSPNIQMTGYTLASEVCFDVKALGGIVDAMQVGAGFVRFGRHPVTRTKAQVDEWLVGTQYSVGETLKFHEAKTWPMTETSCGNYGGCDFLPICSKDPSSRERFLAANYERRVWDPLVPR